MIDGYVKLENGVIKQNGFFNEKIKYDDNYMQVYREFGELGIRMSYLRLGNLIGSISGLPESILDVGYGSGDFLKVTRDSGIKSYGSDISGCDVPDGVTFVEWNDVFNKRFDVITFFDALEHFEDIDFVKDLNCDFIVISLPWCHNYSDEWFKNWKHRKPDEHLFHFNDISLIEHMSNMGYECISLTNVEDVIRKSIDNDANILTGVFRKKIYF